jgi:hypothetical protein
MACARCDFYVPKWSSEAQLREAKHGLQRMLVEISPTDSERAAVEGDQDAIDPLIAGGRTRPLRPQPTQLSVKPVPKSTHHYPDPQDSRSPWAENYGGRLTWQRRS